MAHRSNYADGGATPAPGNITASDMNGISADLDAAATLTGAQTLTNKTITDPKVNRILDSSGNVIFEMNPFSSATTFVGVRNNSTGARPYLYTDGPDATIPLLISPKGAAQIHFFDFSGGIGPQLWAQGVATDVDLNLDTQGAGVAKTNGIPIVTTTSIQTLTNKTLTTPRVDGILSTSGGYILEPGTNTVRFYNPTDGRTAFAFFGNPSAVNYVGMDSTSTGGAPIVGVYGTDTDIGLRLGTAGAGVVLARNDGSYREVATISGTQTLTNKTVTAPVLSGTTTGTYTLAGTPTITSPTITSPTVTGLTTTDGIDEVHLPNGITNANTARQSQACSANTNYYITNSNLNLPATLKAGMAVGTRFTWRVHMDKTGAGTGTFGIVIYRGTNGSTSDTADVTQTVGTQTAVVDNMVVDVQLVVTTTGASGAYFWQICPLQRAATATGFGVPTGTTGLYTGTVSGVAMNTASLKFGLAFRNGVGTGPTVSVPMVQASAINIC